MIGFQFQNANPRCLLVICVSLLLGACASPYFKRDTTPSPAAEPVVADEAPAPAAEPAVEAAAPEEELSAQLLYSVLLGEIAGQRGALDISGASYLDAALSSRDPRVAERALKIAVFGKQQDTALKAARRWVELAPDNLEAHYALAALALRTGNREEVLAQFDYLLQSASGDEDAYQQILALLAREPDVELAQEVMQQLVDGRADDADARYAYARLAVHAENWPLAEQQLGRCLELRPDWTAALILRAQLSHKQGRSDEARRQLQAAVQRKPLDGELRLAYARLLVDLEAFAEARDQYRVLLRQQPENTQVIFSLALLALEQNELDNAREMFEKLLQLGFEPQQVYYYLGAIAEEQGDVELAMQRYDQVGDGDHWLEVQIRMARLEAQTGNVEGARERLRKMRLAQPAQAQRLFLVEGDILSRIDWHEEAYTLYSQYLDNQPDDIEILYARSLVAERLDRIAQAEADLRRVLELDPDNARALNALGYTLTDRTDRHDEALGYISRALEQAPDDPAVIDSMGWVLYRLGRLQEARDYLQKAYDLNPDVEIAAHLGEVMWMMGDRDAALRLWKQAREATPGNAVLEDTVRRLSP